MQAIKDYEFWLTCSIPNLGPAPNSLPPDYQTWGRSLAIIELSSNSSTQSIFTSDERRVVAKLEHSLVSGTSVWRQRNVHLRYGTEIGVKVKAKLRFARACLASIGGLAIVVVVLVVLLGICLSPVSLPIDGWFRELILMHRSEAHLDLVENHCFKVCVDLLVLR